MELLRNYYDNLLALLESPGMLVQLMLILLCYLVASVLSRVLEPRLEEWIRNIRGKPALLRVLIPLFRRFSWVLYIVIGSVTYFLLLSFQPVEINPQLLILTLQLALAWLTIVSLSQTIRNRSLRQFFALLCWIFFAILLTGIADEIANALDVFGFTVGSTRISLLLLLKVTVVICLAFWASIWFGNVLDRRIQKNEDISPGLKVLIGKILKITLLVLALLIAVSGIGVDLTVFSVLSGAIGVGIGFGLQKVVSNFISGLIILADESIKPGDTITLGETFGWIRELRARFVSVVTRDGREYLIPNEDFITHEVINWSFSDNLVRLDVPFGVSYDSNPHEVTRLAIEAASSLDRVVNEKPPVCWMTEFGDSSLNFLLRFWIRDPQNGLTNIRGQMMLALWDIFQANNIKIPYPHREIIFKEPAGVSEQLSEIAKKQKSSKDR